MLIGSIAVAGALSGVTLIAALLVNTFASDRHDEAYNKLSAYRKETNSREKVFKGSIEEVLKEIRTELARAREIESPPTIEELQNIRIVHKLLEEGDFSTNIDTFLHKNQSSNDPVIKHMVKHLQDNISKIKLLFDNVKKDSFDADARGKLYRFLLGEDKSTMYQIMRVVAIDNFKLKDSEFCKHMSQLIDYQIMHTELESSVELESSRLDTSNLVAKGAVAGVGVATVSALIAAFSGNKKSSLSLAVAEDSAQVKLKAQLKKIAKKVVTIRQKLSCHK